MRSVGHDGRLHGHYLAHIAADAARSADLPHRLLVGDPRFAAPELWAGEEPSIQSDFFALAAVFCYRRRRIFEGTA